MGWSVLNDQRFLAPPEPVSAWPLTLYLLSMPERGRLPSGSVLGGGSHGGLLLHGSPVVRGRHRHLHRPHWQSENGNGNIGTRRAAEIPGREVRWTLSSARILHLFSELFVFSYMLGDVVGSPRCVSCELNKQTLFLEQFELPAEVEMSDVINIPHWEWLCFPGW